jgi:hypothetical protein
MEEEEVRWSTGGGEVEAEAAAEVVEVVAGAAQAPA